MPSSATQPLLSARDTAANNNNNNHEEGGSSSVPWIFAQPARPRLRRTLGSRAQHLVVIGLITLDLLSITADMLVELYRCDGGGEGKGWERAQTGLRGVGLGISCLFVGELACCLAAFGWSYLHTPLHVLDATVILASFAIDVSMHNSGPLEDAAALIVVLRLWRVFKIIEEVGVGASERAEVLEDRVRVLEHEIKRLKGEEQDEQEEEV